MASVAEVSRGLCLCDRHISNVVHLLRVERESELTRLNLSGGLFLLLLDRPLAKTALADLLYQNPGGESIRRIVLNISIKGTKIKSSISQ